ncbi:MAG: Fic family protein [Nitrospirae bacterium]|nr:Fic family protein [Nitrospirota bacterium]
MVYYKWKPIEDIGDNWRDIKSSELQSLAIIWNEQSARLKKSDALSEFNKRLCREWAIETGIIEKLYSISTGITQVLIEKGIEASLIPHGETDRPKEQIVPILKDQEDVVEGLFDFVRQSRELSTSYIKELHQAFTRHQETIQAQTISGNLLEIRLLRGDWKKLPNNPTRTDSQLHEYCPPEHVASEMDNLVKMHKEHTIAGVPPEVESAWLHHRFTQIHPFQDGNGRVARALASLIFLRAGWFPLVISREVREEYIAALEEADFGDIRSLVALFANIQKKALIKALSLSENVLKTQEPLKQLIANAGERLKARHEAQAKQLNKVFEVSNKLENNLAAELQKAAALLNVELSKLDHDYLCIVESSNSETDHWFKKQIVEVAKELGYYADTRTYRSWVRLKIREERHTEIVFSFHCLGVEFLGVMAASAFIEYRDRSEDGGAVIEGPYRLCSEVFSFTYNQQIDTVIEQFSKWLNDALINGIDQWRRQL